MLFGINLFFFCLVVVILNSHVISQNDESDDVDEILDLVDKRGKFTLSSVRPDKPRSIRIFRKKMRDAHNDLRSSEGSGDMVKMRFDKGLTKLAQAVADTCVFKHTTKDYKAQYSKRWNFIGENIWAGYRVGHKEPQNVAKAWYNEKRNYNYEKASCSGMCGHYTQVVWAESKFLGCGVKFCNSLLMPSGKKWKDAYYVVCEYGPGGNKGKQKPFHKGHPCEKCPTDCIDGKMCRKFIPSAKRGIAETEKESVINNFLDQLKRLMQKDMQVNRRSQSTNTTEDMVLKRDDDEEEILLKRDVSDM